MMAMMHIRMISDIGFARPFVMSVLWRFRFTLGHLPSNCRIQVLTVVSTDNVKYFLPISRS